MKKIFFLVITGWLLNFPVQAQTDIVVQIKNLKDYKGLCRAYLFDRAAFFPNATEKALTYQTVEVSDGTLNLTFRQVPAGVYAIAVIHDRNANGKLDTNFLGIPTEGYGASKNALPKMSQPSFADNAFEITDKPVRVHINMRY